MENVPDLKGWLEYDYNPFIMFTREGDLAFVNQSAELLLSYEPAKTFHDLALTYAPIDFGYKTTFLPLEYEKFHFYALTVGYEDEEHIGVKLYQNPRTVDGKMDAIKEYEYSNIYVLIDINITLASGRSKAVFKKEMDPTLPEFKLSQNEFSKALRKVYEDFEESKKITTVLKLTPGEFLFVGGKKHQILELIVKGDLRSGKNDRSVREICDGININVHFAESQMGMKIPMVL